MRPEILAPAGSMEALKAAVHAGADAVYLGGNQFGARAYANNFDDAALVEAIEYCHLYGVKVYLTINTLFRDAEILALFDYLNPLYQAGLDAVIVQDFGVMKYVHEVFHDLPIHASTQMTITTSLAYQLLKDYGVTRIVPARELSMKEISSLKMSECKPEVEVFVQGALCYCYSGQCLMSSMIGGRSGNRGRCAQTCRLPYSLYDENENLIKTDGEYLLSPKDLCGLESIPDLIKAGVDSFKIEGRMKRPEYVAVCVRAYRELIDAWYSNRFSDELVASYKEQLLEVFNRGGFTKGYYWQKNGKDMMSIRYPGHAGVQIGVIEAINKNQITILLKKAVAIGDVLMPEGKAEDFTLTCNKDGKKGQRITLNVPKGKHLSKGQIICRMTQYALLEELKEYVSNEKEIRLDGTVSLVEGENAKVSLTATIGNKQYQCEYVGDSVEVATKQPISSEIVESKIRQTGNTRYVFGRLQVQVSEQAFYSVKQLKELRRNAIALLEKTIIDDFKREDGNVKCNTLSFDNANEDLSSQKYSALISTKEQYDVLQQYNDFTWFYLDMQYLDKQIITQVLSSKSKQKIAIVLPPIIRKSYQDEVADFIKAVFAEYEDVACVVRNIDELSFLKTIGFQGKVFTDYSLYVMNAWSAAFVRELYPNATITLSVELNENQIKNLSFLDNNCEISVYGYQQLMVSAQCLQATSAKCSGANKKFIIKDRYLKNFFIFSICKYCYNIIYNGVPTVLYDMVRKQFGNRISMRLHFTMENADETKMVVEAFLQDRILEKDKTRGHYRRGVE